ncbi:MAG TPA: glycosyltransferase family 39 protein [Candidatus Competibacteraceae bacterium]|nr:glycosyltransferase family 39 protein [Candidatus Competibacteraceae bacterium]
MNSTSLLTRQITLDRRSLWILASLLIIALIGADLRLQSVFQTEMEGPAIRADARDYVLYAYNLKNSGIYSRSDAALSIHKPDTSPALPTPDALRTPGYPLFLSLFIGSGLTGQTIQNILLAQVILGIFTILLTYDLGQRFLSTPLALLAALLTALSPHLATATIYVLTETLFCFLITLCFWQLARLIKKPAFTGFFIAGALLGAAALTRPAVQYFIVPLALLLLAFWKPARFRLTGALVLGFALIFLPWTARNLHTLGKASDESLMIGTLHHGMYPDFLYNDDPKTFAYPYRYDPESARIAQSIHSVVSEIGHRLQAEPARYLKWFLIGKPLMLWSWNLTESIGGPFVYPVRSTPYASLPYFRWSYQLMEGLHWLLVALAALGSVLVWLPRRWLGLADPALLTARTIALLLLFYVALHMVGAPFPRYSVPMRPFLYVMALLPPMIAYRRISQLRKTSLFKK